MSTGKHKPNVKAVGMHFSVHAIQIFKCNAPSIEDNLYIGL